MRVLVTGASGFLGTHLSNALREQGHFVVDLVRDIAGLSLAVRTLATPSNLRWVTVYGSFDQVERVIAEYELDTVIHLAAQTQVSVAAADPIGSLEANARGTWQVLEACRRQKVRRVVVASSDKVYGDGPTPYVEDQALRPHGVYAASKACADIVAQAYLREFGAPIAITRCGNLYGPAHLNWSTLIPSTIRSVLRGERPRLRNCLLRRDYLYVADAVDGYLKLADSAETGAFNFGTGRSERARDVAEMVLRLMGSGLELDLGGAVVSALEIGEQAVDCSRAAKLLGWDPRETLETGLAKTIEWYRNHEEMLG